MSGDKESREEIIRALRESCPIAVSYTSRANEVKCRYHRVAGRCDTCTYQYPFLADEIITLLGRRRADASAQRKRAIKYRQALHDIRIVVTEAIGEDAEEAEERSPDQQGGEG